MESIIHSKRRKRVKIALRGKDKKRILRRMCLYCGCIFETYNKNKKHCSGLHAKYNWLNKKEGLVNN